MTISCYINHASSLPYFSLYFTYSTKPCHCTCGIKSLLFAKRVSSLRCGKPQNIWKAFMAPEPIKWIWSLQHSTSIISIPFLLHKVPSICPASALIALFFVNYIMLLPVNLLSETVWIPYTFHILFQNGAAFPHLHTMLHHFLWHLQSYHMLYFYNCMQFFLFSFSHLILHNFIC